MIVFFAKLVLGDNCVLNEECTGTPNAGICIGNQQDSKPLICQCTCNYGFMRYNGKCLQGTVKINECTWSLKITWYPDSTVFNKNDKVTAVGFPV